MALAIFLLVLTFFAAQVNTFYDDELDLRSSFLPENDFIDLNFDRTKTNYICEFNETLPAESAQCNYLGNFFKQPVYRLMSNWGCYLYTQPNLMNSSAPRANVTLCAYNNINVPCFLIQTPTGLKCFQLDERIPEVLQELRRTLISESAVRRWLRCTVAANKCCSDVMANLKPENNSCPAIWDAWSCFNPQKAGEVSREVCPEFAYSNTGPACHHYSQKECFANATWNPKTDYSTCSITPRLVLRVNVHVACLATSIALCAPAVLLLACYRRLRVRRLALHRNLLAAILIRNVLVIISKSMSGRLPLVQLDSLHSCNNGGNLALSGGAVVFLLYAARWRNVSMSTVVQDELTSASGITVMSRNEFPCKLLASMEKLASSAVFTCMLVDGIFLHRSIVAVFRRELNIKLVFSLAAAATLIPVIIWICLMATMNDANCWIVYSTPGIQWVLDGPRIAMLAVNTLLLLDILRIILTKLRRNENSNNLSTTKATLFLMPLFGVQFLLTAWRPVTTSCDLEQGYYFFTYIMDALQGVMVATLYCYLNKEVHTLLKATYKKTETVVSTRFRTDPIGRRATAHKIDGRRDTFSTMVDNRQNEEDEDGDSRNGETNPRHDTRDPKITPSLLDTGVVEDVVPKTDVFIPSDLSSEENSNHVNSLTILSNAYSPSDDGFINLDFEHDETPNRRTPKRLVLNTPSYSSKKKDIFIYDKLNLVNNFRASNPCEHDVWSNNPAYEEDVSNLNGFQCENVDFRIKPRTTFVGSEKLSNVSDKSKPKIVERDIFKIPDIHNYDTIIGAQNQIPNSYLKNEDIINNNYYCNGPTTDEEGLQTINSFTEKADLSDEVKECVNDSSSFADFSLPTNIVENIDALGIYEDIYKSTNSKTREQSDNEDWDDVIIDPVKLCPNRSKDDKIYFLNE